MRVMDCARFLPAGRHHCAGRDSLPQSISRTQTPNVFPAIAAPITIARDLLYDLFSIPADGLVARHEEHLELATVKLRPSFEICASKTGDYLIVVTWPKGPEQQLDGFATVEAAQAWIENDAPGWITESTYSTIRVELHA